MGGLFFILTTYSSKHIVIMFFFTPHNNGLYYFYFNLIMNITHFVHNIINAHISKIVFLILCSGNTLEPGV